MSLISKIKNIVGRIVVPSYPEITDFEVTDLFETEGIESWLGNTFTVDFTTSECLTPKEQMKIDTEVKNLFRMLSPEKKGREEPKISCFFDCGDGEGFTFESEYGYKH